MDYTDSIVTLQLQPGQTDIQHRVTIVDDSVLEMAQETFMLNLQTSKPLVTVVPDFGQALVTIIDDDSKLYQN